MCETPGLTDESALPEVRITGERSGFDWFGFTPCGASNPASLLPFRAATQSGRPWPGAVAVAASYLATVSPSSERPGEILEKASFSRTTPACALAVRR